ncbi:MAG: hypothetical protein AAFX58_02790 [Pseudomonadota bacterium]
MKTYSENTAVFLRLGASGLLLSACGGGGGGESLPPPPPVPPPPPAVQTGVFKDSNVAGIDYVSGAETGTTGDDGRYTCETGNTVSFAVGAVELGETDCTTLASPPELVGNGQFDDPQAVNMARFLQLLDLDEDPVNGITISADLQQMADNWPALDFASADLDAQLTTVFSDIQSVDGRTVTESPSAADALAQMDAALACGYGGAFVGSFDGTNAGTVAFVFARSLFGFSPNDLLFLAFDPAEEFQLSTSGPYEPSTRTAVDSSAFDQTVLIDAQFDDPDTLSGSWSFPPESASGNLTASRFGGSTGQTRFVGQFAGNETRGVIVLRGGETSDIVGEAFDVVDNTEFSITGIVDQATGFTLTVSDGASTFDATANLFIDTGGSPRIDGSWDDGTQAGGQFQTVGCRLN